MKVHVLAGWTVILAATGLAAVSGNLAYHGFDAMLSIPYAGWIGPFVAASLIGLGVGVESEIRDGAWLSAIVLGALLLSAAALDKHSGELALIAQVEAAEQSNADRQAAYDTAVTAKAEADGVLAGLTAELALLSGDDVVKIQKHIGTTPDGRWGQDTAQRVAIRKDQIAESQRLALSDARKWADVIAEGAPVVTLPFTMKDAELYALLITGLAVILAFAGSWIAHPREELAKIEGEMDLLEGNVVAFERFLDAA